MPVDPTKAVGFTTEEQEFTYDETDVILYNLGIGFGSSPTDPQHLRFTYENSLAVFPTFGVVPSFGTIMLAMGAPGFELNPMMILHGEQYMEVRKHPIPLAATLVSTATIAGVYDKGKGALILIEVTSKDKKTGDEIFFNRFSIFARGEGGFGGEAGPAAGNDAPEKAPDAQITYKTLPQQALLYRLSGDRNPLHADPGFAALGGFDRPILHGLCSFGYVARAVLETYADSDPAKFKSIQARFAKHVFPGESIQTNMWQESRKILFNAGVVERDGIVISNAAIELTD